MSLDQLISEAIATLFPDHAIPDQNNKLPSGDQHKAPDFSLFEGKLLIEQKSRTHVDDGGLLKKIYAVAEEQGRPIRALGHVGLNQLVEMLPDPNSANRKISDYLLNKVMTRLSDARKQFEDYEKYQKVEPHVRIVVMTVETNYKHSNSIYEYRIARAMGGLDREDQISIIDAVLLFFEPSQLHQNDGSYWCNCLLKNRLTDDTKDAVVDICLAICNCLLQDERFNSESAMALSGRFRPLRC